MAHSLAARRAMLALAIAAAASQPAHAADQTHAGADAFGDDTKSAPGVSFLIRPGDLPPPRATPSATEPPRLVERPADAHLDLPPGFAAQLFAAGFDTPRQMKLAPNGDIFLAESGAKRIRVLRQMPDGKVEASVFAAGLRSQPYGIALYPPGPDPRFVYVADEGQVLRYPYRTGDTKARGAPQIIVGDIPPGGRHWTRDIVFSPDGKHMLVAVGSADNDGEGGMAANARRADILDYDAQGHGMRIYASGIRNPVTIAFYPGSNVLWASVNERDELGDNLPPDYVTRVKPGGFYGLPWFYIGGNQDPRHPGARADLKDQVAVPDVLIQAHSAPLGMAVYTGRQFPPEYRASVFVALHGSWNRSQRTGYKIIRIPVENGQPTGGYQDFMTGFVTPAGAVWGRPVGIVVAKDGSLLVSDDGSGTIWRVSYGGGDR